MKVIKVDDIKSLVGKDSIKQEILNLIATQRLTVYEVNENGRTKKII